MSRHGIALAVAVAMCAIAACIVGFVCLGIWLATTGRDGWMVLYSFGTLFVISYVAARCFAATDGREYDA